MEYDDRFGSGLENLMIWKFDSPFIILNCTARFSVTQKEVWKLAFIENIQYTRYFITIFI
jgi:hypothetical protein